MRGRKPKPTALKALEGNPGKRRLNEHEPKPKQGVPSCPAILKGQAKVEWYRVTRELASLGLVTQLDRAALAAYCNAWARWVEAEEQVQKLGQVVKSPSGFPIQNPYLAIANKAKEQMHRFSTEFGLTPASRSRINGQAAAGSSAPGQGLQAFNSERPQPLRIAR